MGTSTIGKTRVLYMGREGMVGHDGTPDWSFLYADPSTTRDPAWYIGDRVELPDKRAYRYCTAGTLGVVTEMGAAQLRKTSVNAVAPAQASATSLGFPARDTIATGAKGSLFLTVTIGSGFGHLATGVLTKDELRGAYIVIGNGSLQHPQMATIVGHPALAAAGTLTVQLAVPLVASVSVGTTNIEIMMNPYTDLSIGNAGGYASFLGVPVRVATVGQYFWLQTHGPCWITSDNLTADDANDRMVYFRGDGAISSRTDVGSDHLFQPAGFVIDASSAGASNAPFVMLQLD